VKHPAAYAQRITAGISPGQAREILTDSERATERVMLAIRLAAGRVELTGPGRLLADAVIRALTS
jgi:oxygen-independent coproporphyrinogen-3 oxidase